MAAVDMDGIRVEGQPGAQRGPHVELVDSVTNVQIPPNKRKKNERESLFDEYSVECFFRKALRFSGLRR